PMRRLEESRMSEKAEAFGREDEPSTAHDSATDAIVGNGSNPRPDTDAGARSEPLTGSPASAPDFSDPVGDDDTLTDGFSAALLARVAAEPRLQDASPAIQDEVESLMRAAEELVEAALKAGGARAWHRLPEIAASISRRVARRDLSISALPEALSRLGARFG